MTQNCLKTFMSVLFYIWTKALLSLLLLFWKTMRWNDFLKLCKIKIKIDFVRSVKLYIMFVFFIVSGKTGQLYSSWKVTEKKCYLGRTWTTSAFRVQLYIHAIQRGQLVSLGLRDGYGGHRGDDLLFFLRLLRCVCVDYRDLPVGHPARGGTTVGSGVRGVGGPIWKE